MEKMTISYDNANAASKWQEAQQEAWELEDEGATVNVEDEPVFINEGTSDIYQDGGTITITWEW